MIQKSLPDRISISLSLHKMNGQWTIHKLQFWNLFVTHRQPINSYQLSP